MLAVSCLIVAWYCATSAVCVSNCCFGMASVAISAFVALQIHLRVVQQSLVVRQCALRHIQLNLIRPRVDLGQDLALP